MPSRPTSEAFPSAILECGFRPPRLRFEDTRRYTHYGPPGETEQLTNAHGAVVDEYTYAPYGSLINPWNVSDSAPNPLQFGGSVGYYTDPNTDGLILCGQRWYSPAYARWLSRDPTYISAASAARSIAACWMFTSRKSAGAGNSIDSVPCAYEHIIFLIFVL